MKPDTSDPELEIPLEEVRFLPPNLPLIWPEARNLASLAEYRQMPPVQEHLDNADLISGVLVGAAGGTVRWLRDLVEKPLKRRIYLVLVVFPANPTREKHLRELMSIQDSSTAENFLEIRVLPLSRKYGEDDERAVFPPTAIQAHNSEAGKTMMCLGSSGDAFHDPVELGSLNLVFDPGDALRDEWRRWFEYLRASATRLSDSSCRIPHLIPAKGDPEAHRLWKAFESECGDNQDAAEEQPTVDLETGEVLADKQGEETEPWDEGTTALDHLARVFQDIYSNGWLVTVNEASRIKPLKVPVKATLLDQQSERSVGRVTQQQRFSLQVLEDDAEKAVEKCRTINDLLELLSYPLSKGNRWLPKKARALLEREIEARNEQGKKELMKALGGKDVDEFVKGRTVEITKDLNRMYSELGEGDTVPEDKLTAVLDSVKERLKKALEGSITPEPAFNPISAPDLTQSAPDLNWSQPLSLIEHSAIQLRKLYTDSYFPRKFSSLVLGEPEFREACNAFSDHILEADSRDLAEHEQGDISDIMKSEISAKEKCQTLWKLVTTGEYEKPKTTLDRESRPSGDAQG